MRIIPTLLFSGRLFFAPLHPGGCRVLFISFIFHLFPLGIRLSIAAGLGHFPFLRQNLLFTCSCFPPLQVGALPLLLSNLLHGTHFSHFHFSVTCSRNSSGTSGSWIRCSFHLTVLTVQNHSDTLCCVLSLAHSKGDCLPGSGVGKL